MHLLDHFPLVVAVHAIQVAEKDHVLHNLLVVVFPLPILNFHEIMSGFGADHINPLVQESDHVFIGVNDSLAFFMAPLLRRQGMSEVMISVSR